MKKNTYLTSHFPLISIVFFSAALALHVEGLMINRLVVLGVYQGMLEFFSESGIKLTLLFLLILFFFMIFAALKLIADTTIELSLLFFSKDHEGTELNKIRTGSWFYLIGSFVSMFLFQNLLVIVSIVVVCSFLFFIFFVFKVSDSLSPFSMVGLIFFHIFFWFAFIISVLYALLKLYNSFIASLPI